MRKIISVETEMRNAYLDYAMGVITGNRRMMPSMKHVVSMVSFMPQHAGGPDYKGVAAAALADVAVDCAGTGADGAPPADGGDDDGDGGDDDPESDRAHGTPCTCNAAPHHQAPNQRINLVRIIRMAGIVAKTTLCKPTIYKLIKEKDFPPSIKLTGKAVGWFESDIDAWLISRINKTHSVG